MKEKIPKWLKYAFSLFPNEAFFSQLSEQAPPLFEEMVGYQIEWDRCNLFIEPIDEKYIFHLDYNDLRVKSGARELVVMKCAFNNIKGSISWYNDSSAETIYIDEELGERKLKFRLQDFHLRRNEFSMIPNLKFARDRRKILFNINSIDILYEMIPHEGYIAMYFDEIPNIGMRMHVETAFHKAREAWNAIEGNGLFHEIAFDSMNTEKTAYFYFDLGSAQEGALELVIKSIKDQPWGIKRIEIIPV